MWKSMNTILDYKRVFALILKDHPVLVEESSDWLSKNILHIYYLSAVAAMNPDNVGVLALVWLWVQNLSTAVYCHVIT